MILPDVTVLDLFLVTVCTKGTLSNGEFPLVQYVCVCVLEWSAIIFEEEAGILQSSGGKLSFQFSGHESCLCEWEAMECLGVLIFFSSFLFFTEARVIPEGGTVYKKVVFF